MFSFSDSGTARTRRYLPRSPGFAGGHLELISAHRASPVTISATICSASASICSICSRWPRSAPPVIILGLGLLVRAHLDLGLDPKPRDPFFFVPLPRDPFDLSLAPLPRVPFAISASRRCRETLLISASRRCRESLLRSRPRAAAERSF